MSRRYQEWTAKPKGRVHATGRSVVLPVQLDRDRRRTVNVIIPRSHIDRILSATLRSAVKIDKETATETV